MESPLRYRAGAAALSLLRTHGFDPARVSVIVGPASGPKWLVLPGIDRALRRLGLLAGRRRLLVGASAGAWRMLALAARDPEAQLEKLIERYVGAVFPRGAGPALITAYYREMWRELLPPAEVDHLLGHAELDLAIHTARQRWPGGSRPAQMAGLAPLAAANFLSARSVELFYQRVLFHSGPERYAASFAGRIAPLRADNLHAVALATGSVPLYLEGVLDPPHGPRGRFADGGMTDYHLRQRHDETADQLVLFPHFQRRIAPTWLDKTLTRREPGPRVTDNVLQIYPSPGWTARLPEGRPPDRDDFLRFVDAPEERMRRWNDAVAQAAELEEALLDDIGSGRLVERLEPMTAA